MIDEVLVKLAALSDSDLERTVESLRRVHAYGDASASEGSAYEHVLRRIEEYQQALEVDQAMRRERAGAPRLPARATPSPAPPAREDEPIDGLFAASDMLLEHPAAGRAMALSLMRAGQRFAQTEAGRRWMSRLRASEAVERACLLWDQLTHGLLGEPSEGERLDPVVLLDALLAEAQRPDRERRLKERRRR